MGKMMNFLTILIFIDIIFLITGQVTQTVNSSLFSAILDPSTVSVSTFAKELFGNVTDLFTSGTGLLSLFLGATGVITGIYFSPTDTKLFIPIGATLGLLAGDFVGIYSYLAGLNKLLGVMIISPIVILYYFTVVEWVRGKD